MNLNKKILAAVVTFAASLFLAVLAKISVIRTGYKIGEIELQHKAKVLELAQLEYTLTRAKSFEALKPKAKEFNLQIAGDYPLSKIRFLEK